MSGMGQGEALKAGGRVGRWLRGRWPAEHGERAVLIALAGLVAAGTALRVCLMLARSPGFLGYHDTFFYLNSAIGDLLGDLIRPAGYVMFLRLVHVLSTSLSVTILVQHVLGVATALLLFATVRRVAPAVWGLVPAAVVLLAGPQLFLEHAVMSEPLFAFVLAALAYCAVRALDGPLPWAYLVGLLAAASACVRSVGSLASIVAIGWLLVVTPGGLRRQLVTTGAAALCAWLLIAVYVVEAKQHGGPVGFGLTQLGGLNLYAGVAGFADCDRFTPPAGTRSLCERRPPSERPGPYWYWISPKSPGLSRLDTVDSSENAELSSFARAAMLHQPVDWASRVGADLTRFWSSDIRYNRFQGESYGVLARTLVTMHWRDNAFVVNQWYRTGQPRIRHGLLDTLRTYERHTRLEGPALLLLVLLALAGIPLARGRRLSVGILMLAIAAAALVGPVATAWFNARFAVPGYGSLAAAGAIGAASLWERALAWLARRRGAAELPGRVAA